MRRWLKLNREDVEERGPLSSLLYVSAPPLRRLSLGEFCAERNMACVYVEAERSSVGDIENWPAQPERIEMY